MEKIKKISYESQPLLIQKAIIKIIKNLMQKYQKFSGINPLLNYYPDFSVELNAH